MDVGKIVDVLVLGTRGRGSGLAGQRMIVVLVVAVLNFGQVLTIVKLILNYLFLFKNKIF